MDGTGGRFTQSALHAPSAGVARLPRQCLQECSLGYVLHVVTEAQMDVLLLNVMGSAAVASAIVVAVMANRLSKELAGL
ncbi:hypothetical protein [Microvirga lotononidis]|uniref:Uncharacterized protein n=1 Tax=Microvirga lotononidis TaxID=864069 RepID=I4YW83_9HYPH|nr:hypothetical protein [Microvirga lotononidis]EIM28225.1 hypothetical protein MicloDRAFT_00048030 [Microvirga lotononidis]WQO27677.1 hypothetical protein U0023_00775 [Microvirga lotononidis]